MKKCIYCREEIPEESVIDFCKRCGVGVWGEKMFNAILENMESARDSGDLCHSQDFSKDEKTDEFSIVRS
jgi:uncharacterized UBP type Zn finger protein